MKTFVCSLLTVMVITVLVFANGSYFSGLSDKLTGFANEAAGADSDPDERAVWVEKIEECLEDNSFLLSLSVGHDETASLFSYLSEAKHAAYGEDGQFLAAIDKLTRNIERLKKTECFCLDGLF